MLLLMLFSCTYTVQDYWSDLAKAHCQCSQEGDVANCRSQWEVRYQDTDAWEQCRDDPSPISRSATKKWVKDYTESCRLPDTPVLYPDNPNWAQECSP